MPTKYTYGLTLNQLFTETMHDAKFNSSGSRITITKQSPIFYEDIIFKCLDNDSKLRPTATEIEKTLEFYEQAFSETMLTDNYTKMNQKEKDQVFIQFYHKNKLRIQRFVNEQFPQQFPREITIEISHKKHQSSSPSGLVELKDFCRTS